MKALFQILEKSQAVGSLLSKKGFFAVDDTLGVSLLVATAYQHQKEGYNVVASNLYHAQKIYDLLSNFVGEENCLFFPVDEMLRVEAVSASKEMLAQRLYVMNELLKNPKKILITHVAAATRYVPKKELYEESCLHFQVGNQVSLEEIRLKLIHMGYEKVNKIDQSLQFAIRGDILDIFSVNMDLPLRIEFFDDEIESIRLFDIPTQCSKETRDSVDVLPASDLLFNEEEKEQIKTKLLERLTLDQASLDEEKQLLLKQKVELDMDNLSYNVVKSTLYPYYGYLQNEHYSILDYASSSVTLIVDERACVQSSNTLLEEEAHYFIEAYEEGRSLRKLSMYQDFSRLLTHYHYLKTSSLVESDEQISFSLRPILAGEGTFKGARLLIESYLKTVKKILIVLSSAQQKEAISDVLNEMNVPFDVLDDDGSLPKEQVGILLGNMESGFELVEESIAVLTSHELFGYRNHVSRFLSRYKEATILKSYEELEVGDYVVHEQNGIGQFLGIRTLLVDGIHRDYLHIAYAGTDVLYVPLEQFKLVRKYVGKDGARPKLNRLGSTEWEKTKRQIKERVNDMAERLILLYAKRLEVQGFAFKEDDEFQKAFESQFPFELTKDQERSLKEIKEDMEKPIPMDRLLCGDVGFGKTEIAFRAAFKAILSGKQVGLLCPTTLLARQHYERALDRFSVFGVKIAILSRLVPESTQKQYLKQIEEGKIHLIIGTHRLLSKEIKFHDLGLLIVDEEQRFGVEQKERIKELKSNVDVLTLTATPIPRTLQMSLVGIRQLSQLNSAPTNRMPIQTYVVPFKVSMIRELMERELARKGQVFYLHNQVSTIYSTARKIQEMIPDAHIGVVHGQMDREMIEDVMTHFYHGELDILVCTSIIETGIDIANANMILIEDADHFGLSQLYQIKGRVGRGNRIAYAYLMYKPNKSLSEVAQKRLKAIQDFTELGSGYRIAQRDLMIRGAGDILGAEQAGFIDSVGMDMYIQLLNEVLEEKKTGKKQEEEKAKKALTIDAYIPSQYANESDKIEMYQEIEGAKTKEELEAIEKRIADIYGKVPLEVRRLFLKKRIDFYLETPTFDDLQEYADYVDIVLNAELSNRNGIGIILFQELTPFLSLIKVTIVKKQIKIRLTKKEDWPTTLVKLMEKIEEIAHRFHD